MTLRVLVENDPILRAVSVILDPTTSAEYEEAVAEFYRHDVPRFLDWRDDLRARIPGLFPAEVLFADDQEDFRRQIPGADVAVIESFEVGESELAGAERLRAVLNFGTVPRHIDFAACLRAGVQVEVQRRWVNVAVAEHALALMLSLAKRLPVVAGTVTAPSLQSAGFDLTPFDRRYTANSNFARVAGIRTLAGSTLAILGLGAIGREVARIAAAFEMRVSYHQRQPLAPHDEWTLGVRHGPLSEIVADADFVSLHLPLNAATRGIVDARLLERFKSGALLVNVARAELVERSALVDALDSGRLGGYGLDVGYEEPALDDDPLLGRPNVILTPHTAVGSRENAIRDMEEMYGKLWRATAAES